MACPIPKESLTSLKMFVEVCKKEPQIFAYPELNFFREYIESLGGVINVPLKKEAPKPEPAAAPTAQPEPAVESDGESDVELDYEGVIQPDNDPPQSMGNLNQEVSEEDFDKSNERKKAAMELYGDGKVEEAISAYTEAILLNPTSGLLYAKRGQCYLQLQKPTACIRDCTRALQINPDSASAYKFRGRANRLLGNFVQAAEDLRNACKIDYDEQADEWLKEVTPNARKLEEHQRKYERKRLEKEVRETRERVRKMKEDQAKMREEREKLEREMEDEEGGGGMGDFLNSMKDPEILEVLKDPEVAQAFTEIAANPINVLKYQNNPKISAVINKLKHKFAPGDVGGAFPAPSDGGSAPAGAAGADVELD